MQTMNNNDAALQHVSKALDEFCADASNFVDNDNFSRKGSLAIVGLLADGLATVNDSAFAYFLKPRLSLLASLGALDETHDAHGATSYRVKRRVDQAAVMKAWQATGTQEHWFPDVRSLLKLGVQPNFSNEAVAGLLLMWRDGERGNIT